MRQGRQVAHYDGTMPPTPDLTARPFWQRLLWAAAGACALVTGIVGVFVPLLPTTPFVLLAAFCFSRSSTRCERWLVNHPRFGPAIRNWRAQRVIPLRAKQLAWAMMALGSAWAWWVLPLRWGWLPAACCLAVALWMARLPSRMRPGPPPA
jgi:uncharacterized membrane protein YbaN (DUF454 family)